MGKASYKSEEERMQALADLPDSPEPGENADVFLARIEEMKQEIQSAPIEAEEPPAQPPPGEPATVTPPPAEGDAPPAAPAEPPPPEDEVVFTYADGTPVRRSELPDDLRKYRNGPEIIKQAAHARQYANAAEKQLQQLIAEREQWQRNHATPAPAGYSSSQIQAPSAAPQQPAAALPPQSPAPAGQPRTTAPSFDMSALDALESDIDGIDDPTMDPETLAKLKKSQKSMAAMVKSAYQALSSVQSDYQKSAKQRAEEAADLKARIARYEEQQRVIDTQRQQREAEATVDQQIRELTTKYPTLKLSKPHTEVEARTRDLADRYFMARYGRRANGRQDNPYVEINQFVNKWNQRDPDIMEFCKANGIRAEDVGVTDTDILNYASLVHAFQVAQGYQINPITGEYEALQSPWVRDGKRATVSFPNALSAYEYLRSVNGIPDREMELRMAQAERAGEDKITSAVERSAVAAKAIGRDGSVSPSDVGQEMSEDAALEVIGHHPGPRTINDVELVRAGRSGDRRLLYLLQKAQKRLGFPLADVPEDWPAERVQQ
jgi:hypothetical protein